MMHKLPPCWVVGLWMTTSCHADCLDHCVEKLDLFRILLLKSSGTGGLFPALRSPPPLLLPRCFLSGPRDSPSPTAAVHTARSTSNSRRFVVLQRSTTSTEEMIQDRRNMNATVRTDQHRDITVGLLALDETGSSAEGALLLPRSYQGNPGPWLNRCRGTQGHTFRAARAALPFHAGGTVSPAVRRRSTNIVRRSQFMKSSALRSRVSKEFVQPVPIH